MALTMKQIEKVLKDAGWTDLGRDTEGPGSFWQPSWMPKRHRGTAWLKVEEDCLHFRKPGVGEKVVSMTTHHFQGPITLAHALKQAEKDLLDEVCVKDILRAIRSDLLWAGTDVEAYSNALYSDPSCGLFDLEVGVQAKGDPAEAKGCGLTLTVRCSGPTLASPHFEDTSRDTWHLALVALRVYEDGLDVPLGAAGQVLAMTLPLGRVRVQAAQAATEAMEG
jgi:hypothetical protein